jgi:hypothetical protein
LEAHIDGEEVGSALDHRDLVIRESRKDVGGEIILHDIGPVLSISHKCTVRKREGSLTPVL